MSETILSGDIGGTNARLDLYQINSKAATPLVNGVRTPGRLVYTQTYQNSDFKTFADAVHVFLKEAGLSDKNPPITACIAVAGPVNNNSVLLTNRDGWAIDGNAVAKEFGIQRVSLINDFVAVGYGLAALDEATEVVVLQDAPRTAGAPMACIGAGTGLGECFLTPGAHGHYTCYPTEGGHAEYAPRSLLEIKMLAHMLKKFSAKSHRVSVERVVSGIGLSNVYEFLALEMPEKIDSKIHSEIQTAGDLQGKIIATNRQNNELCALTMDIFAQAYGSEAGVAALKWLPQAGLYISGGLTPKNIDLLKDKDGPFLKAFRDKGRVSGILDTIPVLAVMVEDVGQRGAYREAYQEFLDLAEEGQLKSSSPKLQDACRSPSCSGGQSCCRLLLLAGIVSAAMFAVGSKARR